MSKNILEIGGLSPRTATIKILVSIMFILFLCSFISATTWAGNISVGLVSYYTLDDNNLNDSIGANNGTNSGTTNVSGKIISARNFTASESDYINLSTTAGTLDFTTENLSINAWIKYYSGANDQIVSANESYGFYTVINKIALGKIGVDDAPPSTTKLLNNTWVMATVVYDQSANLVYYYMNGTADSGSPVSYSTTFLANTQVMMGRYTYGGGAGAYFDGLIDEVAIFNRSLSSVEVSLLYNSYTGCQYGNESCFGESREINLISPINGIRIGTTQTNLSANYSSRLYNFTNTTYYIWHDNGTLFNSSTFSLTGNTTNSSMNFSGFLFDDYIWNVKACVGNGASENCSMATSNYTFRISPFSVNNISYPLTSLETSTQLFHINISAISGISSVTGKFWINGTSRTANVTDGTSGVYKSYDTIDMPLNNATSNMTFFWQFDFTFSDSSTLQQNSSSYSTQVNRTIFQICNTTYPYPFVNFTTKSATNPFPLVNTIFKSAWTYWVGSGLVKRAYTHEDMNENLSSFAYCGSPNVTFYTNAHIEYDASAYALNSYFLNNASLTNTTNNISLYLLNNSLATVTVLKVVDNGQHPMEDVEIQILFYDVGTGTYYAVGIASTDFLGKDIVYLNWYDSLYKFILTKNGVVIKSTNTTKISESPVTFEIKDESGFVFDKFADFQYNLYFNNVTNNFVLTFTKPSGEVDEGCLRVVKRSASNDTQVCLICEESSSATLYCDISSAGNGTFVAAFYATGSLFYIDWISETIGVAFQETIYNLLGNNDATFYMFMIAGFSLAMLFVSPIFGIIGILIGLGAGAALGFTLIDYGEFIGIILLGGIIVWILKR